MCIIVTIILFIKIAVTCFTIIIDWGIFTW